MVREDRLRALMVAFAGECEGEVGVRCDVVNDLLNELGRNVLDGHSCGRCIACSGISVVRRGCVAM